MNEPFRRSILSQGRGLIRRTWPLVLGLAALGLGISAWIVHGVDRGLRANLLVQTRMAAQALDMDELRGLSGTEADWVKPEYQRIKMQLESLRTATPNCRFIYLLGRTDDGDVFFYVDCAGGRPACC